MVAQNARITSVLLTRQIIYRGQQHVRFIIRYSDQFVLDVWVTSAIFLGREIYFDFDDNSLSIETRKLIARALGSPNQIREGLPLVQFAVNEKNGRITSSPIFFNQPPDFNEIMILVQKMAIDLAIAKQKSKEIRNAIKKSPKTSNSAQ